MVREHPHPYIWHLFRNFFKITKTWFSPDISSTTSNTKCLPSQTLVNHRTHIASVLRRQYHHHSRHHSVCMLSTKQVVVLVLTSSRIGSYKDRQQLPKSIQQPQHNKMTCIPFNDFYVPEINKYGKQHSMTVTQANATDFCNQAVLAPCLLGISASPHLQQQQQILQVKQRCSNGTFFFVHGPKAIKTVPCSGIL